MTSTAAVLLAAGAGSRFTTSDEARHKLLAPFKGRTVVWWAAQAALSSGVGETLVVAGAVDLAGALPDGVSVLRNPDWKTGQASSLQTAVCAARGRGFGAVVVGLGDQPLVEAQAWRNVAASSSPVAVATYNGARRNPVKLSSSVWQLLPTSGDEGARSLIRSRPDLVEEVPCPGEAADIDTREDLIRWS